jgi:glutathione S-transferase
MAIDAWVGLRQHPAMFLIGQYDSPFVRRVAIAMRLYGIAFEHRPWSSFGDADKLRPYNPLTRVPTLVLDDGETIIDSHAILDFIDGQVPPQRRMFPVSGDERRRAIKVASLAAGMGDKLVSLFYEQRLHEQASDVWVARCRQQIGAALEVLEADRSSRPGTWWFGEEIGHADIAVACVLRFAREVHSGIIDFSRYPTLLAHCEKAEALPAFVEISQPFIPPA